MKLQAQQTVVIEYELIVDVPPPTCDWRRSCCCPRSGQQPSGPQRRLPPNGFGCFVHQHYSPVKRNRFSWLNATFI